MKKAFGLMEVLFTLLIISIITALAVNYYPNDKEISNTSLISDAQNIINEELTFFQTNNCFANVDNSHFLSGFTGEVKDTLGNTFFYSLSEHNVLLLKSIECDDHKPGFVLNLYNDISEKEIQFNYCIEKIPRKVIPTTKGSYISSFTLKDFCTAN